MTPSTEAPLELHNVKLVITYPHQNILTVPATPLNMEGLLVTTIIVIPPWCLFLSWVTTYLTVRVHGMTNIPENPMVEPTAPYRVELPLPPYKATFPPL